MTSASAEWRAHPHPDPAHVLQVYRSYLVGQKRAWRALGMGARCLRGIIHHRDFVQTYLAAKRHVLSRRTP